MRGCVCRNKLRGLVMKNTASLAMIYVQHDKESILLSHLSISVVRHVVSKSSNPISYIYNTFSSK